MAEILKDIDSFESLVAVTLVMAFVLLLAKPVKGLISNITDHDPIAEKLVILIEAIEENNQHQRENVRLLEDNRQNFKEVLTVMRGIHLEIAKGK